MSKKVFLFSVLLSMLALPMMASAYDFSAVAPSGQTLYYDINSDNSTVTVTFSGYESDDDVDSYNRVNPPTGDVIIPTSVFYGGNTYSITSIGYNAFINCDGLTSVSIPNSVTSIGEEAFAGCRGLILNVPNSVISIGNYSFYAVPLVYYSGNAAGGPWGAKCVNGYLENGLVYTDTTKTALVGAIKGSSIN